MSTVAKRTTLAVIVAFAFFTWPSIVRGQRRPKREPPLIKRTYDKFHDLTSVSPSDSILVGDNAMFSPRFEYAGASQPQTEIMFRLLFIAPPSVWPGANDSALIYVLLDGKQPSKKIDAKYSSTFRVANIVSTVYSTTASQSEFGDIACATKIDMRIGLMEGTLKSKDVAALKALYEAAGGTCR